MRRPLMTIVALALFAASLVVFCVTLGDLLETGTCASGNQPYVIARECPEGTGWQVLLLGAAIIGLLISFLLAAARGGGGRERSGPGLPTFLWGAFFTGTGGYALVLALTSDTIGAGGELGGIIVGATFLLMGVPVLIWCGYALVTPIGDRRRFGTASPGDPASMTGVATGPATSFQVGAAPVASAGAAPDRITELERLQRLRDSGALTDGEFEREKARVLGA